MGWGGVQDVAVLERFTKGPLEDRTSMWEADAGVERRRSGGLEIRMVGEDASGWRFGKLGVSTDRGF